MSGKIGGKNFDVTIGDMTMHVESATLSIEDATAVAKTRGIPNGHVDGEVAASGDLVIDASNFKIISEAAKNAGSWRTLPEFDILFFAKSSDETEFKVEAFGCKIRVESLVNITANGGEKHTSTLKFDVTSPDFVCINGVPYLDSKEIDGLI